MMNRSAVEANNYALKRGWIEWGKPLGPVQSIMNAFESNLKHNSLDRSLI